MEKFLVKIRVRGSPYKAIVPGRVGQVQSRNRIGTTTEQVKVLFRDGTTWSFYPDELMRLDGSMV